VLKEHTQLISKAKFVCISDDIISSVLSYLQLNAGTLRYHTKPYTELCEKVLAFFTYNLLHLNNLTMFQTSASFHSINEIKIFSLL